MDPKNLKIIIDAIVPKKKKAGDIIIEQGDDGDNFYVIEKGTLKCTKRFGNDENETYLKTYQPGESFGELALLYNAPRAATITANEEVVLWSLDRKTFNHILKGAIIKKR